ncbi:MAG TPA: M56 family metallopeptidase [Flavisolibacter sp.]|nr:M56 family metallopeptidase [Flavisolibacter sp.]
MIAFAYYLLKVVICSGILFLYYHAFLRNRLFHQWNRFYLLTAVVLSLCLPFIKLDVTTPQQTDAGIWNYLLLVQSADNYMDEFTVYYHPQISSEEWLMLGYGVVCIVFLAALAFSIFKIFRLVRKHKAKAFEGFTLLPTKEPGSPFSFLKYIFWNEDIPLNSPSGQQIFKHELVHVTEKHTWDKLFMQVVLAFFWCNPFFWLIRRELRFLHEFIADQKAVGSDTEAFAKMILHASYPQQFHAIRNPFFQSSIKRRLHMLTQLKNPRVAYLGRLVALPLMATVVFAFTVKANNIPTDPDSPFTGSVGVTDTIPKVADIKAIDIRKNKEKNASEIEIHYNNGKSEVLTENEASERGLINRDYSNRKLDSSRRPAQGSVLRLRSTGEKPLFIVDGQEVSEEEISKLNPNTIRSVSVLKGNSAEAIYGNKGKNGVVEIKTKAQASSEPVTLKENGEAVLRGRLTNVQSVNPNSVNIEAEEVTVIGKKSEKSDVSTANGEVVVQGYRKEPLNKEITVVGRKMESQPVFEKAEFAPSVDQEEWRAFLQKYTSSFIEEVGKKAPTGTYTVNVRFIVEKDGTVSNVNVLNDPGYGMGSKVAEMMKHAPKWKPAIQNERVVRSYHTQPITFVIADT